MRQRSSRPLFRRALRSFRISSGFVYSSSSSTIRNTLLLIAATLSDMYDPLPRFLTMRPLPTMRSRAERTVWRLHEYILQSSSSVGRRILPSRRICASPDSSSFAICLYICAILNTPYRYLIRDRRRYQFRNLQIGRRGAKTGMDFLSTFAERYQDFRVHAKRCCQIAVRPHARKQPPIVRNRYLFRKIINKSGQTTRNETRIVMPAAA